MVRASLRRGAGRRRGLSEESDELDWMMHGIHGNTSISEALTSVSISGVLWVTPWYDKRPVESGKV